MCLASKWTKGFEVPCRYQKFWPEQGPPLRCRPLVAQREVNQAQSRQSQEVNTQSVVYKNSCLCSKNSVPGKIIKVVRLMKISSQRQCASTKS